MQEEQDSQETKDSQEVLYTVRQVASEHRVAESTVWRWVDSGRLPAYRLPGRRIRIKKKDAEMALKPALAERGKTVEWQRWIVQEYGTGIDQEDLVARVRRHGEEMVARRGGRLLPSSVDDLREAREELGRRLDDR